MKKLSRFLPIGITITIFVYAAIVLLVYQQDLLYAAQDMSVWRSDEIFFEYYMQKPFGLLQYGALFLTQFFYYPWLGTLILLVLWAVSAALTLTAFRFSDKSIVLTALPTLCLLVGITQMGYWIYFLKLPSYWFLPTLLWLWWSVALVIISFILRLSGHKKLFLGVLWGLWCLVITPWRGFTLFLFDEPDSFFYVTFIVMGVIILLQLISRWIPTWASAIAALLLLLIAGMMNYRNECFQSELRMQQYAEQADWQDIMDEMAHMRITPSRQQVLLRDIALLHTGNINDTTSYDCNGIRPEMRHGPKLHMAITAGPIIYFSTGYINDSYRWTIENGIEYGLSPRRLRMLLRCALAGHEWQLSMRYIRMLRLTLFHSSFADSMLPLVGHPERFAQHPELLEASNLKQTEDALTPANMYPERVLFVHHLSPLYNHRTWHFNDITTVHFY